MMSENYIEERPSVSLPGQFKGIDSRMHSRTWAYLSISASSFHNRRYCHLHLSEYCVLSGLEVVFPDSMTRCLHSSLTYVVSYCEYVDVSQTWASGCSNAGLGSSRDWGGDIVLHLCELMFQTCASQQRIKLFRRSTAILSTRDGLLLPSSYLLQLHCPKINAQSLRKVPINQHFPSNHNTRIASHHRTTAHQSIKPDSSVRKRSELK